MSCRELHQKRHRRNSRKTACSTHLEIFHGDMPCALIVPQSITVEAVDLDPLHDHCPRPCLGLLPFLQPHILFPEQPPTASSFSRLRMQISDLRVAHALSSSICMLRLLRPILDELWQ